jgi:hypothetical protein
MGTDTPRANQMLFIVEISVGVKDILVSKGFQGTFTHEAGKKPPIFYKIMVSFPLDFYYNSLFDKTY